MQLEAPSALFSSRSVGPLVVTFPLLLGSAVSIVSMIVGEVAVLAVLLGWGDRAEGTAGRGPVVAFAVLTATVAAVAMALGAMVCGRLLLLRDVAVATARRVALGQSALVAVLFVAHGIATASPALPAVVLFGIGGIVGAAGGAWLGIPARWREEGR